MTLSEALTEAQTYWGNAKSGRVQHTRAATIVRDLGWLDREVDTLRVPDGVRVLTWLRDEGYSSESIHAYYASFKRVIALAGYGGLIVGWPSPPPKPRKSKREPISEADIAALIGWFRTKGYGPTADLACVLWGTGLRVDREALGRDALAFTSDPAAAYDVLQVTGKGGHERVIPVVDPCARQVLGDPARMEAIRRVPYVTHLKRWNVGLVACGITSKKATPHAVRHAYITNAHKKSGGNLALAQSLAGHSDPATTARYIAVDIADMAGAL